jgi:acyl-homoserine-lactone acylase
VTTSNNWAIGPQRSRSGKSLLANDLAAQPRAVAVELRADPRTEIPGGRCSIAGLPMVLSGFNGKVAWSMSAVKGDNQDLFLEKSNARATPVLRKQRQMAPAGCATKPSSSKASADP